MKQIITCLIALCSIHSFAQPKKNNLVYVDKEGVIRWTKDKKEASFFGVNYTVPFAYGFRSHKALGIDPEKAIDADVYHMSRLGLDAFRVHVWDVEITDSVGNLLDNEHLRLFDYLLQKLKERNIKILVTPIAFWGNGYPERDQKTNGFSSVYGKGNSVVLEAAIKAQENYMVQFFRHVNPYTKLSYKDDPDVIAMEINNEPHHSGPKEKTTEYVNRLTAAVRSTGWTKPVFYNISESPSYADAVAKSNVDGHSFQWYPSGLVAGRELKGNYLPHVDFYRIPFIDTVPEFRKRARMVYEFDAGDILQPIMYPAMVRSFRTAGFQWATQFAYDPMYTAYANTEYQTHYLNLAYTPAKAISLLIASKAFHVLPRGKSYGSYPADTLFDVFRVSYAEQLSEMNSDEEFYYSNTTKTKPRNLSKLKHIAGVGHSPVVEYNGTGAYFLDKLDNGIWRLEIMPDALQIRDPFEKASPKKEVTRIDWKPHTFKIILEELGNDYVLQDLNSGTTSKQPVITKPGVYIVYHPSAKSKLKIENVNKDFYAPAIEKSEPFIIHKPIAEVTANKSFRISGSVTAIDTADRISIELRNSSNKWKTLQVQNPSDGYDFPAEVPADMVTPGQLNYRIIIRKNIGEIYVFPGGFKGDPYAWDEYRNESYQVSVPSATTAISLFDATTDRNRIMVYNTDWRNNTIDYTASDKPGALMIRATMNQAAAGKTIGWQNYFADRTTGRVSELSSFTKMVIKARSEQEARLRIGLISVDGDAFYAEVQLTTDLKEIEIPFSAFQKDSMLLLPRPYPGFLPLKFGNGNKKSFDLSKSEKLEVSSTANAITSTYSYEVESIWLRK